MGTIKIELELPEFKKEVEIKVIINKDGVLYSSTPTLVNDDHLKDSVWRSTPEVVAVNDPVITTTVSGTLNKKTPHEPSNVPSSMTRNY